MDWKIVLHLDNTQKLFLLVERNLHLDPTQIVGFVKTRILSKILLIWRISSSFHLIQTSRVKSEHLGELRNQCLFSRSWLMWPIFVNCPCQQCNHCGALVAYIKSSLCHFYTAKTGIHIYLRSVAVSAVRQSGWGWIEWVGLLNVTFSDVLA